MNRNAADTTHNLTAAFGPNQLQVSRLGFGGATAGLTNYIDVYDAAHPANRETMLAALRHAVELGVTYFDTAPGYGDGLAETIFGEALQGAPVFLATKVPLSAAGQVRQSLEGSSDGVRKATESFYYKTVERWLTAGAGTSSTGNNSCENPSYQFLVLGSQLGFVALFAVAEG